MYLTGSYPGKFYGNAKVHNLSTNNIDDLTLRPFVSNIGTATYETAKYLASLLEPLSKSEFTINRPKNSLNTSKNKRSLMDIRWFHLLWVYCSEIIH